MIDFFEKYAHQIIPEPNSGCFLWIGAQASAGYGHGHRHGKHFYAHISAYEMRNGIGSANGYVIRHTCDTPPCCNPDHLLKGTNRDNTMDSIRRGRAYRAYGEKAPTAKLTDDIVANIRELAAKGMPIQIIRKTLNLLDFKWNTIRDAAIGKTWSHLGGSVKTYSKCSLKGIPKLRGEDSASAILTEAQVKKIRKSRKPGVLLAKMYGVKDSTISAIKHRRIWKHVP